jgi:acetyl esterase/lipase
MFPWPLMRFTLAFLLLMSVYSTYHTDNTNLTDQPFHVISDVPYCTGGGEPLLMDVFIPEKRLRTPAPAVLWLHGGGWERGDKNGSSGAELLAAQGFVTASIFYRLSGDWPFPADIEDCKCAIRYLRANAARYGIDASRIGVAGASAGGQLAMLVALAGKDAGVEGAGGWSEVSSGVQAVSSWYGATDFAVGAAEFEHHTGRAVVKLFRGTLEEKPQEYRRASPITYVSASSPPLLLIHGEKDEIVPFDQAVRMKQRYDSAGASVEFIGVKNAGHDFKEAGDGPLSPSIEEIHQRTIEFFKKYLLR